MPKEMQVLWLEFGPPKAADFVKAVGFWKEQPMAEAKDIAGKREVLNDCVAEVEQGNKERANKRKLYKGMKSIPVPLNQNQIMALCFRLPEHQTIGERIAGMIQDQIAELQQQHMESDEYKAARLEEARLAELEKDKLEKQADKLREKGYHVAYGGDNEQTAA